MNGGLIVLDPAHGGQAVVGGSAPGLGAGAWSRTLDKHRLLELGQAIRSMLSAGGRPVRLTREADENPSIEQRAGLSAELGARAFVSLELGRDPADRAHGVEAWIHADASPASHRLARELVEAASPLIGAGRGVLRRDLPLLHPARHRQGTAACTLVLGYSTSAQDDRRLELSRRNGRLGAALAQAIARQTDLASPSPSAWGQETRIDIQHQVPLVPQLTGMSCWAAAAAMLVGWRDCVHTVPDEVARGAGRWESYRIGLLPSDVPTLARHWRLHTIEQPLNSPLALAEALEMYGPLWVGEASPGLHSVVVVGLRGDGGLDSTQVLINDPWPLARGERYQLSFRRFVENIGRAAGMIGGSSQVLRTGGRSLAAGEPPSEPDRGSTPEPALGGGGAAYGSPVALFHRLPTGEASAPASPPLAPPPQGALLRWTQAGQPRVGIRLGPSRILTAAAGLPSETSQLRIAGAQVRAVHIASTAPSLAVIEVEPGQGSEAASLAAPGQRPVHDLQLADGAGVRPATVRTLYTHLMVLESELADPAVPGSALRDPARPGGPVVGVVIPDELGVEGRFSPYLAHRLTPELIRWALGEAPAGAAVDGLHGH